MAKGIIFDIKEFAVYDGPGMRQTVFFKGCPLRCSWCHNPEGFSPLAETFCVNGESKTYGKEYTSRELADIIIKNNGYYERYGGGVTFSGGEPLMQHQFLGEVLDFLKEAGGVHTAIETSGFAEGNIFQTIIQKVDYIMLDLKLMDEYLHKKFTGASNDLILHNAEILAGSRKKFVIRIPLIPGVSDTEENICATAEFLKNTVGGSPDFAGVELLNYHKTAGAKYKMINMEYKPGFDADRELAVREDVFEENGVKVKKL